MPVIHIGDGKHIMFTEGELRAPPPPPPHFNKGKPIKRKVPKLKPDPKPSKAPHVIEYLRRCREIPGYAAWIGRRVKYTAKFEPKGFRGIRPGQAHGYTRKQAEAAWKKARKLAKRDMEVIKQKIELDAAAEEALQTTLEVMRGPGNASAKLAAARLVLEYTKAKPTAKQELTVNTAEDWLAKLATDDDNAD